MGSILLFNVADALTHLGFTVHPISSTLLALSRKESDAVTLASIVVRDQAPTPAQIAALEPNDDAVIVCVVPSATQKTFHLISEAHGIALLTADGKSYFPGVAQTSNPFSTRPRGRIPWSKYALIRALLRTSGPRTQVELASEIGVSQASVSMMLKKLSEYTQKTPRGWAAIDRSALWDDFLTRYPGPGGVRTYWYSRQTFGKQAQLLKGHSLLSADGAADELAPWRSASYLVAYAHSTVDMTALGFSPALSSEATVEIAIPADCTLFTTAKAWGMGVVDPVVAAWDLAQVGGPSANEAVAQLKMFVMNAEGEPVVY